MSQSSLITLGGGCFWCVEAAFEQVVGVNAVESGYCNGRVDYPIAPTYRAVCAGDTGFVEVVRVSFDTQQINLSKILAVFFKVHDPITLNRQGNDVGTQYRSGIYAHSPEQLQEVRALVEDYAKHYPSGAITTEVDMEKNYSRAEDYHQHYFANNPNQGYCMAVISPKIKKLRQHPPVPLLTH